MSEASACLTAFEMPSLTDGEHVLGEIAVEHRVDRSGHRDRRLDPERRAALAATGRTAAAGRWPLAAARPADWRVKMMRRICGDRVVEARDRGVHPVRVPARAAGCRARPAAASRCAKSCWITRSCRSRAIRPRSSNSSMRSACSRAADQLERDAARAREVGRDGQLPVRERRVRPAPARRRARRAIRSGVASGSDIDRTEGVEPRSAEGAHLAPRRTAGRRRSGSSRPRACRRSGCVVPCTRVRVGPCTSTTVTLLRSSATSTTKVLIASASVLQPSRRSAAARRPASGPSSCAVISADAAAHSWRRRVSR